MPKYFYTAKSLEGETKTGSLLAKDTHELAQNLKKKGLVLIEAVYYQSLTGIQSIYTSSDGISYALLDVENDVPVNTAGSFYRIYITPLNGIPANTNYLKIVSHTNTWWHIQLCEMTIYYVQ